MDTGVVGHRGLWTQGSKADEARSKDTRSRVGLLETKGVETHVVQWLNNGQTKAKGLVHDEGARKQSDESCPIRPTSLEHHRELSV